jgi:vacuolar protein sorting-associated protein 13A/C
LIINRTDMDLFFSAKSLLTSNRATAGQSQQDHKSDKIEPIMFSYSTLEPLRSRALVKALDSEWSKPVSFEAVGSAFMLNLAAVGGRDILLGLDVTEGMGKYHLSKIVTVSPRFILRNNLNQDISYSQAGVLTPYILKAGQVLPVLKLLTSPDHDDYHMCVRFTDTLSAWSNPFSLTQIGNIYLKIGRIGSLTEDLIRVDVTIDKATIFISFTKEDGNWPFKIENHTAVDVTYYQQGSSKTYSIVPGEEQVYAWDFPSFEDKKFTIDVNGRARLLEFTELGDLVPFKYPIANGRAVMALELVAQGPTIILKMKPFDARQSSFVDDRTSDAFKQVTVC